MLFLAIEAGKHAFKSFVTVNVIDNNLFMLISLRSINSSISSFTAFSISSTELPVEVVAPLITDNLSISLIFSLIFVSGFI